MTPKTRRIAMVSIIAVNGVLGALGASRAAGAGETASSYAPVVIKEDFQVTMSRMKGTKTQVMDRQKKLLEERYDQADRPANGVTMADGKPVQEGVRVKLPEGMTWRSSRR